MMMGCMVVDDERSIDSRVCNTMKQTSLFLEFYFIYLLFLNVRGVYIMEMMYIAELMLNS